MKLEPDQVSVNGCPIAADLGDSLVVQDDNGDLWKLVAVSEIKVLYEEAQP